MDTYRVAISADLLQPDGTPAFEGVDLSPLHDEPRVELVPVRPGPGNVLPGQALAGCDALILLRYRFMRESVPDDGRLSVVARFGVGYDSVDLEACTEAGIAVVITPDGVRRPVAVATLTLLLAVAGRLLHKDKLTRTGPPGWERRMEPMAVGLVGRTLGLLGIGNIGAEVLRMAKPLELVYIAHDPYADPKLAAELGVELVGLEDLFRRADFLSVNCPLNDETRGLVSAERIGLMKPSAFLINTARGPIVDQAALTAALRDGRIAGAGLDVFDPEPTASDEPLHALDNVILTPHALSLTDQCVGGIAALDIKAVLDVMHGRVPETVVNRPVLETERWRGRLTDYRALFGA